MTQQQHDEAVLWVVVGQMHWGRGTDRKEAMRNWRAQGSSIYPVSVRKPYMVLAFGPETEFLGVDGFGTVSWDGPEPMIERHEAR